MSMTAKDDVIWMAARLKQGITNGNTYKSFNSIIKQTLLWMLIDTHIYIYIYIYIERERERKEKISL